MAEVAAYAYPPRAMYWNPASMKTIGKGSKIDGEERQQEQEASKKLLEITKKPQIFHEYSRTVLAGFFEFCQGINWDPIHIVMFLSKKLNAEALRDSLNRVCFKGRLDIHKVESLLLSYHEDFVTCNVCGCTKSEPLKEVAAAADDDSSLATCKQCGTERRVPTVPVGRFRVVQGYPRASDRVADIKNQ